MDLFLTDQQLAELENNPEYRHFGKFCPVCRGTKKYRYKGEEHDCPDSDYGHEMLILARRYWLANIGLQYQRQDWGDYPHLEVKNDIEQYIDRYEFLRLAGVGITFYSQELGVGKTWGATHVLKELVKQGTNGWFVPFWEILGYKDIEDWKEKNFKIGKVRDSELVVIDDIKPPYSLRQQEYYSDKLEETVRPRTDRNLPTIITTNMTEDKLEEYFPRVFSLLYAKNQFIELAGFDARRSGKIYDIIVPAALAGETVPIV